MVSSARNPSSAAAIVNEQDNVISANEERQQLGVEHKIQMEKKQGRMRQYINNRLHIVVGLALASFFLAVPNLKRRKELFIVQFGDEDMQSASAAFSTASVVASNNTKSIDIGIVNGIGVSQTAHQNTTFKNHTTRTTGDNTVVKAAISKPDSANKTSKPEAQTLSSPQPQLPLQSANSTTAAAAATTTTTTATRSSVTTSDQGFYIQTSFPQTFPIDKIVEVVKGGGQLTLSSLPPGTSSVQAVCEFQPHFPHSSHFPHTMQQMYACWSWWEHVTRLVKSSSVGITVPVKVQPILVVNRDDINANKHSQKPDAPFVPGLLSSLQHSINLTIVEDVSSLSNASSSSSLMLVSRPKTMGGFRMSSRLDAPSLRKAVMSVLAAAEPTTTLAAASQADKQIAIRAAFALETKSCKGGLDSKNGGGFPRITILNRIKTRRIINVDKLQSAIVGLLVGHNNNNNATTSVRVEHFEDRSFAEQVSIMANTDIIVSPHGAQLTSLPFMKSQPCGAVLELFPMGYWVPHYFGSLAAASGVNQHLCIYLGNPVNREAEVEIGMTSLQARVEARNRNFEVPMNRTLHVVEKMIQSWRQCCAANVAGSASTNV